jgi:hypothetical protein
VRTPSEVYCPHLGGGSRIQGPLPPCCDRPSSGCGATVLKSVAGSRQGARLLEIAASAAGRVGVSAGPCAESVASAGSSPGGAVAHIPRSATRFSRSMSASSTSPASARPSEHASPTARSAPRPRNRHTTEMDRRCELVGPVGLEPTTYGLKERGSAATAVVVAAHADLRDGDAACAVLGRV